jgi:hypothetical protein
LLSSELDFDDEDDFWLSSEPDDEEDPASTLCLEADFSDFFTW